MTAKKYTLNGKKKCSKILNRVRDNNINPINYRGYVYLNILQYLKLNSLADCRVNANLSFLCKLLDDSIDAPELLSEVNFRVPNIHSRRSCLFYVPFPSYQLRT